MNVQPTEFRRALPNNVEAESALLGAILVNNAAYDRVQDFLEASHFYEPLHRKIFDIASQMIRKGKLVNPMLIKSFLPADDTMGNMTVQQYLIRLAVEATTIVNARDYGLAVHEMWIRREAIASVEDVASIAYDLPADEDMLTKIAPLEDRLASLRAERVRGESRKGAGQEYIDDMTAANQRGDVRGVPICLDEISDVISEPCFEAGNLYGLLSSSGEGKTSLTLQMISHALRKGHPVQFLSYDQNRVQCVRQMIAQEYGIEARRQRNPKLLAEKEWEQCVGFATWLDRQPFEVLKCTDQSAPQLAGFARTFVKGVHVMRQWTAIGKRSDRQASQAGQARAGDRRAVRPVEIRGDQRHSPQPGTEGDRSASTVETSGMMECVGLVGEGKGDGARRYWTSEEARANLEKMRAANGRTPKLNPKPMVPATKAAMIDRIRNYGVGETNAAAKLTVGQVAEIRQSKDKTGDLCRRFNVSRTTIKGIRKGERWRSVGVSA
jgi:hypothetical protein